LEKAAHLQLRNVDRNNARFLTDDITRLETVVSKGPSYVSGSVLKRHFFADPRVDIQGGDHSSTLGGLGILVSLAFNYSIQPQPLRHLNFDSGFFNRCQFFARFFVASLLPRQ